MDIRQLRYLAILSEELSFTRAAQRANVAQPALSRQIQTLERELGVPLVSRTSRRVRMTPAGQTLAERAKAILGEIDNARAEVQDVARVVSGRLSIGITQTPGPLDVVELLRRFHAEHPGVDLVVREGLSVDLAEALRTDELDLAIIAGVDERARWGLDLAPVAREPLVAILSPTHRFAQRRTLRLADVADEAFVLFPSGATIRTAFDRLAMESDFAPQMRFETRDTHRMRLLVNARLAVGVLPISDATRPDGPDVATVQLADLASDYELFLARRTRRPPSPAALAMTETVNSLIAASLR